MDSVAIAEPKKMHPYVKKVLEAVDRRNANEPEFLQAVHEVLETISPLFDVHPEYVKANILGRVCEPERQIIFRVVWEDDNRVVHVNRGFRINFNSVLGPYKGGLRFHPTVNLSIMKFLGFEQIFKNSLTGLYIGGGKGGSDFDPKGRSDDEIMRFCQGFMSELWRHIGANTDVPAGDIGVGSREIGYLFGYYKRLTNRFDLGVLTGKGEGLGGSLGRKQATGFGCVYFADDMLQRRGDSLKGKTAVVSGSGNVAIYTIKKLQDLGAKVVTCSDSDGYIYDPEGIDFELVHRLKEVEHARISAYKDKRPKAIYKAGGKVWEIPCDAAFPCATQNEILLDDAKLLVKNGCLLVCEGANMPTHMEAISFFHSKGVLFGPAKAANAGGVAVSALEMQQNAALTTWSFDEVDRKLRAIMKGIHDNCIHYAELYGSPENYVVGANIGGFKRVAHGMMSYGLI